MHEYMTFIVRLQLDDATNMVSGQISQAQTQETIRFTELEGMIEFIRSQLDRTGTLPSSHGTNGSTIIPE
jgi:hypothetical protein